MADGAPPADRRLRAHRRHPHRRARVVRRSHRLDVRASLRRRPAVRPSRRRTRRGHVPRRPRGACSTSIARRYRPGTATLETTWETAGGRLTLTEGMVAELAGRLLPTTLLVRRLTAEGGPIEADVEFDPRVGIRPQCAARRAPPQRTRLQQGFTRRCARHERRARHRTGPTVDGDRRTRAAAHTRARRRAPRTAHPCRAECGVGRARGRRTALASLDRNDRRRHSVS